MISGQHGCDMSDGCISLTGQCTDVQTVSPCIRIDYKIAETLGLYFGWQTGTPQPVTVLVAATDLVTCDGTGRGKRQWSELNRKNER